MFLKQLNYPSKLLYTPKKSVSHARNIGIENANYRFYFFLDDDDYITPKFLTHLVSIRDENMIIAGNSISFDQHGVFYRNYINKLFKKNTYTLLQNRGFYSNVTGKLIPKSIVNKNRFNEKILIGEDALFMAQISSKDCKVKKSVPDHFYCVRLRTDLRKWHKKSKKWVVKNGLNTVYQYLKLLFNTRYNKVFIFTRIAATLRNLISNRYTPLERVDNNWLPPAKE